MKIVENILEKRRTLFPSKLAAFAAAALVAAAVALVVGGFTQQAVAQTPSASHPFAVGGFAPADTDMDGITHVAFAAQENPTTVNSKNPSFAGHVVQETATGFRSGPVTCLSVTTNTATSKTAAVVWTVKQTNINGDVVGQTRSFEVTDNGDPVMGMSPDTFKDRATDTTCGTDGNGSTEALLRGNIVVSSGQ